MVKNENIEITRILDMIKSKKLVILFILIIFTLIGYIYSYHYVVPKYKATSTLLLIPNSTSEGKVIMTSDIAVNADLTLNSGLIETYRSIGENSKVIKQIINNLGLDMTEEELLKEMKITVMKDTYVIQVAVTDIDPQKAMEIAKEFDEVFLKEIKEIYHLDNIGVVDEAQLPEKPYNINHIKDMILFLAMGIGVSFATVIIFYLFDNTIKKEEEIEKYIQLKSLGSIPMNQDKTGEIVNRENAKSYVTECINTIRTNILYMNSAKNAKTILITSCTPREGKSWVSANIATAFAETDKKVLLMDADMRKGRAHKIFKVANTEGLSNYLYEMTGDKKEDILLGKKYIKETQMPNLHILTNGNIPPNPSELLESEHMKELLEILKNIYDIIIIDAPPCKLVTDSIILSTIVDSTVLVANAERTKMNDFNEVKKSIQMVDGEIIGAILNKKRVAGKLYSKGYYYGHTDEVKVEEVETKQMIPVDEMMKQAILRVEEKAFEEDIEDSKESTKTKVKEGKSEKEDSNIEALLKRMEDEKLTEEQVENIVKQEMDSIYSEIKEVKNNYNQLADDIKDTSYIELLIERIQEEKLTKQQIENVIKEEISDIKQKELTKEQMEEIIKQQISIITQEQFTKEQVGDIIKQEIAKMNHKQEIEKLYNQLEQTKLNTNEMIKEVIKNNTEKLMNTIKDEKNTEQQIQLLVSQKITEMQEETQKLLEQEITKIDYTEQIVQINEMLTNLKDSYLELSNKMKTNEVETQLTVMEEEKQETKNRNIIDFKAFKKQKNKKKVYSIEEDISYEDLEQTAAYVIPLQMKKASGGTSLESYQKTM